MGKKKSGSNLGRSLIKDRFGVQSGRKFTADNSMLHTTELQDGYDWGRLNLQSVTEESSFQEFLATAELTGAEFQAEKLDIKFVGAQANVGLLSKDERENLSNLHEKLRSDITIPRRPAWSQGMSKEELDQQERGYFLQWRKSLVNLQEEAGVLLTPYEKNLEFWRQLWRVLERSDVIIQIVDARNPLLFYCEDLEKYSKEVSSKKINLILVNKADFLNDQQRQIWADFFTARNLFAVFYSATEVELKSDEEIKTLDELKASTNLLETEIEKTAEKLNEIIKLIPQENIENSSQRTFFNTNQIYSRHQLIDLFQKIYTGPTITENVLTVGLVGYPNVGKSSTINSLLLAKKVSVSATPGKTKHFQTIFLDKNLMLCDCPGLVMPSFVFTKAEMIVNGILPVDQMRDHVGPVNLISHLIPRQVLEDKYGIMLPAPLEGEDPERCPTPEELLNSYAYTRGFMTANGQPDNPRAARYILKDFINGKLLFCHSPPDIKQEMFQIWPEKQLSRSLEQNATPQQLRAIKGSHVTSKDVDNQFFNKSTSNVHVKGKIMLNLNGAKSLGPEEAKPWKQFNRHANKNKKEKLRRVYAHLDQH